MSDKLWSACPVSSASALLLLSPPHHFSLSLSLSLCLLWPPWQEGEYDFFFYCNTLALYQHSPVSIQYSFSSLLATLASLTLDIPLQLCPVFLILWHDGGSDTRQPFYKCMDSIILYFPQDARSCKWNFDLRIWGLFLTAFCWTVEVEHIYLKLKWKRHVHYSTVYYLALWALTTGKLFLPSDSVWYTQCNLTIMLLLHTWVQWTLTAERGWWQ